MGGVSEQAYVCWKSETNVVEVAIGGGVWFHLGDTVDNPLAVEASRASVRSREHIQINWNIDCDQCCRAACSENE